MTRGMSVTAQDYPKVALMVITDGRGYLKRSVSSFLTECDFPFAQKILSVDYDEFPFGYHGLDGFENDLHPRAGLAGNIQHGWDALNPDIEFVFHLEDDFLFPGPVPIDGMLSALRAYPNLAQVALKRQPWSPEEVAVGNMLLLKPSLTQVDNLCFQTDLFTFNPCLYPIDVVQYGAGLERELSDRLLVDGWNFGYYGGKHDDPRCIHIGARRSEGYRW